MVPEQRYSVIIVAGGKGLRAGGEIPKQFQTIGNKPVLMHTIEAFYKFDCNMRIVVVLAEDFCELWNKLCHDYKFSIKHTIAYGGETRFHSVKNGLEKISDNEFVAIHDAARPFVSREVIKRCFENAFNSGCGVVPVIGEKNSVRQITDEGSKNIDRDSIKIVQTPQVFPASDIKKAYKTEYNSFFTDDTSVAEKNGMKIVLVKGDEINIKITTPFDFAVGELILRKEF